MAYCIRVTGKSPCVVQREREAGRYCVGIVNCKVARLDPVIYIITCPCGQNYVGKTKRKFKVRMWEHRAKTQLTVADHFLEENHSILSLRYIVIEHVTLPRRG